MAIFDAMLEFSDNQAITTDSATYAADNTLDFVSADLEMGAGEPIWFNARVGTVAFAATSGSTAGACTLKVQLVNETDTTIDSSSVVAWTSKTFVEAETTKGAWLIRMPLPYNVDAQKIIGVLYTTAGDDNDATAATINAWLDHGAQSSHDTQVSASNI